MTNLLIKKIENLNKKLLITVPYRDRENEKKLFEINMKNNLIDLELYKIYYIHQCDTRPFNRGAMKNIGFLAIKKKYPENYKNFTFVFNDIDTLPCRKNFLNYETTHGTIKHFYGFKVKKF